MQPGRPRQRRQVSAGAAETEALRQRQVSEPKSQRDPERPGKEGTAGHSPVPSSPQSPLLSRTELGTQATPPGVRSPGRSRSSAHLLTDERDREAGAASEPGAMSGEGGYNFRRTAIRRKPGPFYLPLGTPQPWRPSSHWGRPEADAFRSQAPADHPGECPAGQGRAGALPPEKAKRSALQVRPVSLRLKEPAGGSFPDG